MANVVLEMLGISKSFPGVKALQDVSISIEEGSVHAICGENGAGKSTLMKVLSGVYPHGTFDGQILLDGKPVEFRSINDSEAAGIAIIHQELALSPYLSIAENIYLGNEKQRHGIIDWNATNLEAGKLLEKVGLRDNPITKVIDIGVGKQQLVEIAKALSKEVRILILDEPTAALNDDDSAHLLDLIRQLQKQGITSIIISHKLNEIKAIADRVTIIRDGRTIETIDMRSGDASENRIIKGMVGRDVESRYPDHVSHAGEELLRVENWTVHHPLDRSRVVVDNATIKVHAGEIVGIAGLMGAGRTELAMSIFGHSYGVNITGQVYKRGVPISVSTVSKAIANGIAYSTEDRKRYGLNLIDNIQRNISIAALDKLVNWMGLVNDLRERTVAEEYRKSMNIKTPNVTAQTGKLSGGNQQKVVLSKWMYADPDVLILDEPTRGIDVGAKYEIYTIIDRLADQGKGVIVISSELPELLGICDRIYTLTEGRITADVPRGEATAEHLMQFMTQEREKTQA